MGASAVVEQLPDEYRDAFAARVTTYVRKHLLGFPLDLEPARMLIVSAVRRGTRRATRAWRKDPSKSWEVLREAHVFHELSEMAMDWDEACLPERF